MERNIIVQREEICVITEKLQLKHDELERLKRADPDWESNDDAAMLYHNEIPDMEKKLREAESKLDKMCAQKKLNSLKRELAGYKQRMEAQAAVLRESLDSPTVKMSIMSPKNVRTIETIRTDLMANNTQERTTLPTTTVLPEPSASC